jgi:hypothetical protein
LLGDRPVELECHRLPRGTQPPATELADAFAMVEELAIEANA